MYLFYCHALLDVHPSPPNLPWLSLLLHPKNEQESICFQWCFFDRNGTTFPWKLSIMTWTVLTSSLLPLLTKLSLHTPVRLGSRLTDTSAARITASSSRETRQPGCVSASPRLKISAQMWPLLTNLWNCVPSPLVLCTELCVLQSGSQQHQSAAGRATDRGVFWLWSSQAAVILPLNTIISFPPPKCI